MATARTIRDEARRRQRAAEEGFSSTYERRVAGVPKGERAAARGHRGTKDFLASLREGDLIICDVRDVVMGRSRRMVMQYRPDRRFKSGQRPVGKKRVTVDVFRLIPKTVRLASGKRDRDFTLRNLTRAELVATLDEEQRRGVGFSPQPSMDQRRLISSSRR